MTSHNKVVQKVMKIIAQKNEFFKRTITLRSVKNFQNTKIK